MFGGVYGSGAYITTPAVARDMISYIKAEKLAAGELLSEAKLWYYGVSYGTVLGATYVSMFPDRVSQIILDEVVDAEDYYNLQWKAGLFQADEAVETFFTLCYQTGPKLCSLYEESPMVTEEHFKVIIHNLKAAHFPV